MKKAVFSIAIAAVFAACSNHKTGEQVSSSQNISTTDTSGLAEFKEWKQKQEDIPLRTFSTEGVNETKPAVEEKPAAPAVVYREAPVKQQRVVRTSKPARRDIYKAPVSETENSSIAKAPAPAGSTEKREAYGRGTTGTEGTAGSGTKGTAAPDGSGTTVSTDGNVAAGTPAEAPTKKDGWSKAAKGAAIGGASGAVIGAVISKNKGKGAVIGGIVGAAGGYIFGRNKDKKDGRN